MQRVEKGQIYWDTVEMKLAFKKYGQVLFAVIGAVAILGTALWTKDTEYENAWLFVFTIYFIVYAVVELYFAKNKK